MRTLRSRIYISKEKIQTLQQDEVGKLVKAERTTRKQVVRKLLFVTPFVWIPFLFFVGFHDYYHYECVDEGIWVSRYALLQKVETSFCSRNSLRSLEWKRVRSRRTESVTIQFRMNNQVVTLFKTAWRPCGFWSERKITRYVNQIKNLTKQGQTLWLFPLLENCWYMILFLSAWTCAIGKLWIECSAEDSKEKSNPT